MYDCVAYVPVRWTVPKSICVGKFTTRMFTVKYELTRV